MEIIKYGTLYQTLEGFLFKATVLSAFIIATAAGVQRGYDRLLLALDSYVHNSYGVLAETDNPVLREEGRSITDSYNSARQNY